MKNIMCFGLAIICSLALFAEEKQFSGFSLKFDAQEPGAKIANGSVLKSEDNIPFTVHGSGAAIVPGISGNALRLNGETKLIAGKEFQQLTPGKSDYTLSCWVQLKKGDRGGFLIVKRLGSEFYSLSVTPGIIRYEMGNTPADFTALVRYGKLNMDEWHYITVVNPRSGDAVLYLDGVEIQRKDIRGQRNTLIGINAETEIGNWKGDKDCFTGEFDKLTLSPKLMTPEEIQQVYAAGEKKRPSQIQNREVKPLASFNFRAPDSLANIRQFELFRTERIFVRGKVFGERFDGKMSQLVFDRKLVNEKEFTLNFWVYLPEVKDGCFFEAPGAFTLDIWHPLWRFWTANPVGQPKPFCRRSYICSPYLNAHEWLMLTAVYGDGELRVFTNGLGGNPRGWEKFPDFKVGPSIGTGFRGILGRAEFFDVKLSEQEMLQLYNKEKTNYSDALPEVLVSPLRYTGLEDQELAIPVLFRNTSDHSVKSEIEYQIHSHPIAIRYL